MAGNRSKTKDKKKRNRKRASQFWVPKSKSEAEATSESLQRSEKTEIKTKKKTQRNDEIWFDGVDKCLLHDWNSSDSSKASLIKEKGFSGLTSAVAMDCEMVGVGGSGKESILARVSIVNFFGHKIYDKFVKPRERVTDYRTHVSGVRPSDLEKAEEFAVVQKEVSDILDGRLLVGHSVRHDLKVLYISHPRHKIRDTSRFFRKTFGGRNPALRKLTEQFLGVRIQDGEHDSVQDAQATMRLYTLMKRKWENELKTKRNISKMKAVNSN